MELGCWKKCLVGEKLGEQGRITSPCKDEGSDNNDAPRKKRTKESIRNPPKDEQSIAVIAIDVRRLESQKGSDDH